MLLLTFCRLQRGLSQTALARAVGHGLSQFLISQAESGRMHLPERQLVPLARVLGASDPAALLRPVRLVDSPAHETPQEAQVASVP